MTHPNKHAPTGYKERARNRRKPIVKTRYFVFFPWSRKCLLISLHKRMIKHLSIIKAELLSMVKNYCSTSNKIRMDVSLLKSSFFWLNVKISIHCLIIGAPLVLFSREALYPLLAFRRSTDFFTKKVDIPMFAMWNSQTNFDTYKAKVCFWKSNHYELFSLW